MTSLETIISLAKRRGFVFPGSDIYGGLSGTWDYGPLGVAMKENIKREWWRTMLLRTDIFALDAAILMNPRVWEASGHVEHFSDPLVDCKKCKRRFRGDDVGQTCPECGGDFTEARQFNMMFSTHAGPVEDSSSRVWLRPETAQGIFVNFKNIIDAFHPALPFGIAQIGKAFRNEITPKNFVFRSREFEQMELEYFCSPDSADKNFQEWRERRMQWFLDLGITKDNIRFRDYPKSELAHYSRATTDIEYRYGLSESGFSELEGIANRGNFDLTNHSNASQEELKLNGSIPHVIEPSVGVDRAFLAFFMDAYDEDELGGEKRVVMRLHPKLAPVKAAVFPLVSNKEHIVSRAREIFDSLKKEFLSIAWDDIGNIGKRYRRQDEIGTPWCITIDYQTLEDTSVTIRDRDSGQQERIQQNELAQYIHENLK